MKLDHLVYAVPNLGAALRDFENRLGVEPSLGGRHAGLGTRNAILPLDDETYVELIAIDPDAPPPNQPRPFGLDDLRNARLVTWAVRSLDIGMDVEHARERGFDVGEVVAMGRAAPTGESLRWQLSLRRRPFGAGLVPFVIDWGDTPHPASRRSGHGAAVALRHFSGFHPDPAPIRRALAALQVDLEVVAAETPRLEARIEGPAGSLVLD